MAKISANYEVVYIIDPAQGEEAVDGSPGRDVLSERLPGGQ